MDVWEPPDWAKTVNNTLTLVQGTVHEIHEHIREPTAQERLRATRQQTERKRRNIQRDVDREQKNCNKLRVTLKQLLKDKKGAEAEEVAKQIAISEKLCSDYYKDITSLTNIESQSGRLRGQMNVAEAMNAVTGQMMYVNREVLTPQNTGRLTSCYEKTLWQMQTTHELMTDSLEDTEDTEEVDAMGRSRTDAILTEAREELGLNLEETFLQAGPPSRNTPQQQKEPIASNPRAGSARSTAITGDQELDARLLRLRD